MSRRTEREGEKRGRKGGGEAGGEEDIKEKDEGQRVKRRDNREKRGIKLDQKNGDNILNTHGCHDIAFTC